MTRLRIATYNIHKCVGSDGAWNPGRIIAVIRAMEADCIAVQEFTVVAEHESAPSPQSFAADAGYEVIEQKTIRRNGKEQYNLLLTRRPLRNIRILSVKLPMLDERGAITADILLGARTLRLAATHLGLPPSARRRQLAAVLDACNTDHALALAGDLNILSRWEPAAFLLRRTFPKQECPRTFPARRPMLAMDRILVRPHDLVLSLRVWGDGEARTASDHLPVVADIEL
jgi:endonuclease/exonuclease/phosphatase family metal-dependent hydrolase